MSYLYFYTVKINEAYSFLFLIYKVNPMEVISFFTVAPISVFVRACVFVAMCRTSSKPFHLLFHMFGVLF
jgi:hypothetical protein